MVNFPPPFDIWFSVLPILRCSEPGTEGLYNIPTPGLNMHQGIFLPFRTFPQKKLRWIIIPTLISHSIVNHWPFWPIFWYVTNIFCLILMFYIFYYDLRCSMHQVEVEVEIKSPEKSLRIKSEMPSLFTITRILQNNSCLSSMIMHDHIHAKVLIIFVSSSS